MPGTAILANGTGPKAKAALVKLEEVTLTSFFPDQEAGQGTWVLVALEATCRINYSLILPKCVLCPGLVAQDLAIWAKPHSVSLFCIDDTILTSNCIADLKTTMNSLKEALLAQGWAMDKDRVQVLAYLSHS